MCEDRWGHFKPPTRPFPGWTDQLGRRPIAGTLDLGFEIPLAYPHLSPRYLLLLGPAVPGSEVGCAVPIPGTRASGTCPQRLLWAGTPSALPWRRDIGVGGTGQPEKHPTRRGRVRMGHNKCTGTARAQVTPGHPYQEVPAVEQDACLC